VDGAGDSAMNTKTMNVDEAEAHFTELLSMVKEGTEIILIEDDRPLARLTPISTKKSRRIPGLHPGSVIMSEDFDEPLGDDFWLGNE
jgi:antitoxin (DNA-binding transcriptional repressor) of toxin-antitoxin stability system